MSNSNSAFRINSDAQLAGHADEIRRLGKRAVHDIIEIGFRLIAAKELCGHGAWLPWFEREFGWTLQTAHNFMNVAKLSKSQIIGDLDIDLGALYRLAAPSTPAEVVAEVVARGREGEAITYLSLAEASAARRTPYEAAVRVHTTIADRREAEASALTGVDFHRALIRSTADELLRSLDAIVDALARHPDVGEVVAALTDAERRRLREGVEAVDRLKAALDETNVVRFLKLN